MAIQPRVTINEMQGSITIKGATFVLNHNSGFLLGTAKKIRVITWHFLIDPDFKHGRMNPMKSIIRP
jgi:hypothetical protein